MLKRCSSHTEWQFGRGPPLRPIQIEIIYPFICVRSFPFKRIRINMQIHFDYKSRDFNCLCGQRARISYFHSIELHCSRLTNAHAHNTAQIIKSISVHFAAVDAKNARGRIFSFIFVHIFIWHRTAIVFIYGFGGTPFFSRCASAGLSCAKSVPFKWRNK